MKTRSGFVSNSSSSSFVIAFRKDRCRNSEAFRKVLAMIVPTHYAVSYGNAKYYILPLMMAGLLRVNNGDNLFTKVRECNRKVALLRINTTPTGEGILFRTLHRWLGNDFAVVDEFFC